MSKARDNADIPNDITVDSSGSVGIGTSSPGGSLEVYKAGTSEVLIGTDNGGTAQLSLYENNDGTKEGLLKYDGTNNRIHLATSGAPNALVIPRDSGNVGIGTASPSTILHVEAATGDATLRVHAAEADSSSEPILVLESSNDFAESIVEFKDSSGVGGRVAYNHGDNALRFQTNGLSERMRIDSSGQFMVNFGQTTDVDGKINASSGNTTFGVQKTDGLRIATPGSSYWNKFSDGVIVYFRSAGTTEGNIQVSGTTVSYVGGHLARWSQLADNTRDASIVKGTVMTNLDQMAVWHHEAQPATYYEEGDELPEGVSVGDEKTPAVAAYDEDNEQLNCMAVSSVEGDANVAGVFVNWDDDDTDYDNDMTVAMTGDMVIRIASGTTVARGDLLMSAGDGTAKPQGDDIVRSKTIAKVTSTTVSHTYDDGSYLVPCVLMAC